VEKPAVKANSTIDLTAKADRVMLIFDICDRIQAVLSASLRMTNLHLFKGIWIEDI